MSLLTESSVQFHNYENSFLKFLLGTFVPLTMEGTIMVDGVLTSCYASIDHTLGHIVMAPMRWFPKIMDWMFVEDSGFSSYANIAEDFGKWMLPSDKINKFRFSN